jgi:hypothetical protein
VLGLKTESTRCGMRMLLILTILLISGCAHNDPWTTRDTVMQVGVTTILAYDAVTTSRIQGCENCYERGAVAKRFLGSQPSTSDTYMYFGTLAISNYLISRALPAKWRPYWQGANIVIHGEAVINNCRLELC